jgi:hypothetical protein
VEDSLRSSALTSRYYAVVQADLALALLCMAAREEQTSQALLAAAKSEGLALPSRAELALHFARRAVAALKVILPVADWPELCGWQLRLGTLLLEVAASRGMAALKTEAVATLKEAEAIATRLCGDAAVKHPLLAAIQGKLEQLSK